MNIIKDSIYNFTNYIHGQPQKIGADSSESARQKRMSLFPPPPCQAKDGKGRTGVSAVKNGLFLCLVILCPPFLLGYVVTAAVINACKAIPSQPQNPWKTNSDKYKARLESFYNKKDVKRNPIVKFVQKTFSSSKNRIRKSDNYIFSKEHNRTLLIQENLVTNDGGTRNRLQINMFKKHTKNHHSPSVLKLHQSLEKFTTHDTLKLTSSSVKDSFSRKLEKQARELKPGESMWVDLTSTPGKHSLKGRIENADGKYLFQMSNTGAGVSSHSNWHKHEIFQSSNFYQTVVQWGPFETPDKFSKGFFHDILNACLEGQAPDGVEVEKTTEIGEYGEALQAIDAIYKTVGHHLQEPADLPLRENLSHWSTLQEGGSCVPNSIWALIRVSLPNNEYQDLRTEIQLHNLKQLYKSIVSGTDSTDYGLLLALEQVRTLIANAEASGKGKAAPKLLKNIQMDLLNRSADRQLKVKIINPNPISISNSTTEVELKAGRLKRRPGELNADVVYESILVTYPLSNNDPTLEIKGPALKIERDDQGQPTGVCTLAFLLYEAILKDENDEVAKKLDEYVGFLDKIEDPAAIVADKTDLLNLIKMFNILSKDFRNIDGTSQSRPKQLALINISQALYTVLYAQCCKENQNPYVKNSAINMADLDVLENLKIQKNEALTFSRLASKIQQNGAEPNIWFDRDRAIQIFHNKNKWNAYDHRIVQDDFIEQKRQIQFDAGVGRQQIQLSLLCEKPKSLVDVPEIKEKNAVQSLNFSQPLDKNIKKPLDISKINVAFDQIYDKALPEIEIQFIDNKPVATTLAGNAYLLYRLLPNANLSFDNLDELAKIMDKMALLDADPSEIETVKAIANFLRNYCERMRPLDESPEAVALQLVAAKLGPALLKKISAVPVEAGKIEPTVFRERDDGSKPIIKAPDAFQQQTDYYEIINPKEYLKFKNSDPAKKRGEKLISLIDHPIFR